MYIVETRTDVDLMVWHDMMGGCGLVNAARFCGCMFGVADWGTVSWVWCTTVWSVWCGNELGTVQQCGGYAAVQYGVCGGHGVEGMVQH